MFIRGDLGGFGFEDFDEEATDRLALDFRIRDAVELTQEKVGSIHMDQRDIVVVAEHADDLLALSHPH
jgi:hypothetical protein